MGIFLFQNTITLVFRKLNIWVVILWSGVIYCLCQQHTLSVPLPQQFVVKTFQIQQPE